MARLIAQDADDVVLVELLGELGKGRAQTVEDRTARLEVLSTQPSRYSAVRLNQVPRTGSPLSTDFTRLMPGQKLRDASLTDVGPTGVAFTTDEGESSTPRCGREGVESAAATIRNATETA